MSLNMNIPTGRAKGAEVSSGPLPVHPLREWRMVEDTVLSMSDTKARAQMVDVLEMYYADALRAALEARDADL